MRYRLTGVQIFVGVSLLMVSCTDRAILDRHVAIADNAWHYNDQPRMVAHITDTTQRYNIYLNLRHTPDYKYSNIFVLLHQHQPRGRDTSERFELRLAEPDGRWLGHGTGSIYAHQELVKENIQFPDTGKYVFVLEQNMRENPLREISDVGIRIEPVE